MSSNRELNDWYGGAKHRDELTEAYEFITEGKFPDRIRETSGELELTPYDQPYRLKNWDWDDLVMYCGGEYAKEEYIK